MVTYPGRSNILLKDIIAKLTDSAVQKFGAEYAEVRTQKLSKTMLTMKEGRVEAAKQGIENGVALRVLVNGAWGFASVGSLDAEILATAVADSCKMAKAAGLKLKTPIKLAAAKPVVDEVRVKPKKNPSEILMEDKIETASLINQATLGYDKRVKSCTIDYLDLTGTDYFGNSEGSFIEQDKLCVWSRITASAKQAGVFTFSRDEIGSTAGYEVFDVETPELIGGKLGKTRH